jgi:hypothetical protein
MRIGERTTKHVHRDKKKKRHEKGVGDGLVGISNDITGGRWRRWVAMWLFFMIFEIWVRVCVVCNCEFINTCAGLKNDSRGLLTRNLLMCLTLPTKNEKVFQRVSFGTRVALLYIPFPCKYLNDGIVGVLRWWTGQARPRQHPSFRPRGDCVLRRVIRSPR